jgi:hypothetical protein
VVIFGSDQVSDRPLKLRAARRLALAVVPQLIAQVRDVVARGPEHRQPAGALPGELHVEILGVPAAQAGVLPASLSADHRPCACYRDPRYAEVTRRRVVLAVILGAAGGVQRTGGCQGGGIVRRLCRRGRLAPRPMAGVPV